MNDGLVRRLFSALDAAATILCLRAVIVMWNDTACAAVSMVATAWFAIGAAVNLSKTWEER